MINPEQITLLERTQRTVADHIKKIPADLVRLKPDAVAFSATEIACHLTDVERLWQKRFDDMSGSEDVVFEAMNPDILSKEKDYNKQEILEALNEWITLRSATIERIKAMDESFLNRVATHPRYGEMDVRRILDVMANHDLQHLEQLKRTIENVSHAK